MRGRELLDKMELVSPVYVDGADETPIIRAKRWPKAAVAAACLCLVAWGAWGLSGGPGQSGPGPAPGPVDTANVDVLSAQARATRPPDASIGVVNSSRGLEPCHGILGLEECWVRREGPEDAANWWYYVPNGDGTYRLVAESWWNAKSAALYEVDLDGDGIEELIFNLVYDDGLREVQVVRSRNGELEEGYFDNEFLRSLWAGQGADGLQRSSYWSWYDPEQGFVVEHSGLDADGKEIQTVDVFQDLEHFKFHACSISINSEQYYEMDKITEGPTRDTEPCGSVLGLGDLGLECRVGRVASMGVNSWEYIVLSPSKIYGCQVAQTWNTGDEPDIYRVDVDGDGVEDLVCNNVYGDGSMDVRIYRRHGGKVERGWLKVDHWIELWAQEGLTVTGPAGGFPACRYDPEQGFVLEALCKDENGGEVRRTAVVQNMEYFEFGIVVRDDPGVTLQNK